MPKRYLGSRSDKAIGYTVRKYFTYSIGLQEYTVIPGGEAGGILPPEGCSRESRIFTLHLRNTESRNLPELPKIRKISLYCKITSHLSSSISLSYMVNVFYELKEYQILGGVLPPSTQERHDRVNQLTHLRGLSMTKIRPQRGTFY